MLPNMRRGRERTEKLVTGTVFILRERSEVVEVFATSMVAMSAPCMDPKPDRPRGWIVWHQITWEALRTVCENQRLPGHPIIQKCISISKEP
jgi:hypothetical protein